MPFFSFSLLVHFSWCQKPLLPKPACSFPPDAASLPPVTVLRTLKVRCMHSFLDWHESPLLRDPSAYALLVSLVPSCRNSCLVVLLDSSLAATSCPQGEVVGRSSTLVQASHPPLPVGLDHSSSKSLHPKARPLSDPLSGSLQQIAATCTRNYSYQF